MRYDNKIFRLGLAKGVLFTALALGLAREALAGTLTTTAPPLILSGRQSTRPPGTCSAGLAEIIKMLDARLDAPVILAYIQNSPIPYNPEATELIALKEHGATTEVLVALLHRGAELRLQLAQAHSAVTPPPPAPSYDNAPEADAPPYPYESPDASSAPYPASDYDFGYTWPWASRPPGAHRHRDGAAPLAPQPAASAFAPGAASAFAPGSASTFAAQAAPLVSTPIGQQTSSPAVPSGGSRASGPSAGRAGGRSR